MPLIICNGKINIKCFNHRKFIFFENKIIIGLSLTETSYALAGIIFRKLSLLSEIDTLKMQTYNQSANLTHLIDLKSRNQRDLELILKSST